MALGITSFMYKSTACRKISSVLDEIENFKRKHPSRVPKIVFDFRSSTSIVVSKNEIVQKWEVLCAGRSNECTRRATKIFEKFKNHGAELIFFLDGPVKVDKLENWLIKRNDKYSKQTEIFSCLRSKVNVNIKNIDGFVGTYFDNFLLVAKKYGEIRISFENECDLDLAEYVYKSEKNVLAVIANDTDFLLMPGNWSIWLTRDFNFEDFATYEWNKRKFKDTLKIRTEQLPLIGVFGRKNYYTSKMITNNNLIPKPWGLIALVGFIKNNFPSNVPLSKEKICKIIHDGGKHGHSMDEIKIAVQNALDSYDIKTRKNSEIRPEWLKRHIDKTSSTLIYCFLNEYPFTVDQSMIDLSIPRTKSFSDLVIPLIRRQMGIALYHQRRENKKIEIYYKPSAYQPFTKNQFSALYPENGMEVPEIQNILGQGEIQVSIQKKFELLSWIISTNVWTDKKLSTLMDIHGSKYRNMLLSIVAVCYLIQENQFTSEEGYIILVSILAVMNTSKSETQTQYELHPNILEERPFWLAHTYKQIIYYCVNALTVCGLSEFIHADYFDGFIFHRIYREMISSGRINECPLQKYIDIFTE